MKKLYVVMIIACFMLIGCNNEKKNDTAGRIIEIEAEVVEKTSETTEPEMSQDNMTIEEIMSGIEEKIEERTETTQPEETSETGEDATIAQDTEVEKDTEPTAVPVYGFDFTCRNNSSTTCEMGLYENGNYKTYATVELPDNFSAFGQVTEGDESCYIGNRGNQTVNNILGDLSKDLKDYIALYGKESCVLDRVGLDYFGLINMSVRYDLSVADESVNLKKWLKSREKACQDDNYKCTGYVADKVKINGKDFAYYGVEIFYEGADYEHVIEMYGKYVLSDNVIMNIECKIYNHDTEEKLDFGEIICAYAERIKG